MVPPRGLPHTHTVLKGVTGTTGLDVHLSSCQIRVVDVDVVVVVYRKRTSCWKDSPVQAITYCLLSIPPTNTTTTITTTTIPPLPLSLSLLLLLLLLLLLTLLLPLLLPLLRLL